MEIRKKINTTTDVALVESSSSTFTPAFAEEFKGILDRFSTLNANLEALGGYIDVGAYKDVSESLMCEFGKQVYSFLTAYDLKLTNIYLTPNGCEFSDPKYWWTSVCLMFDSNTKVAERKEKNENIQDSGN